MQYHSYQPDKLGGVYIYFNQVYDSLNLNYYFNLVVWDDADGQPGSVIWEDDGEYQPLYTSGYPGFIKYMFSEPVSVDGPFYVGWRQYNEFLLNVGLDLNNKPSPSVMFYNIEGTWQSSSAPGVILFRPFIYNETTSAKGKLSGTPTMHIYPNPASDHLYFDLPPTVEGNKVQGEGSKIQLEIFDASGRLVLHSSTLTHSVDISSIPAGIYYVRALVGRNAFQSKLLINP